jgi:hypothetical protein
LRFQKPFKLKLAPDNAFMGLLGKLLPSQIAADVTQCVAKVTDEIMTPEEWAEQWAERTAH